MEVEVLKTTFVFIVVVLMINDIKKELNRDLESALNLEQNNDYKSGFKLGMILQIEKTFKIIESLESIKRIKGEL